MKPWMSLGLTLLVSVALLSLIAYCLLQVKAAPNTMELVRTAGTALSGMGISVATIAFLLQRRVWLDYHERARREKGITIAAEFVKNYKLVWGAASRLIELLDDDCTEKLAKGNEFAIKKELTDHLKAALPKELADAVNCEGETYKLSLQHVYALQWEARSYLNSVEMVLAAAYEDVASKDLVTEQFRTSYDPEARRTLMWKLREKSGGKLTYPYIYKFVQGLTGDGKDDKAKVGG